MVIGVPPSNPTPGVFLELDLGAGGASAGSAVRRAIIRGNMLSSGSATATRVYGPDTAVALTSEADCIALFGLGSELHREFRRFVAVNTSTPLYLQPVAEGMSATASSLQFTVAGSATAAGTLRVHMGGASFDVGFSPLDGYAAISSNASSNFNAQTSWAATSSVDTHGVITLSSKQKGLRSNQLRAWAQVIPTTAGIAVTNGAPVNFSGGTVRDDVTSALAVTAGQEFFYQISCANDATNLGILQSEIDQQQLPVNGIRQGAFAGSTDTLANTITLATAVNDPRVELSWLANSDWTPAELAANDAALYALFEDQDIPRCNFSNFPSKGGDSNSWFVPAPEDGSAPTPSQVTSALQNGITPIGVKKGATYLVKRITSKSLTNGNPDYSIIDAHKRTVSDFFSGDLVVALQSAIAGKIAADDPAKNAQPTVGVVTPRDLKAVCNRLTRQYGDNNLFKNVGAIVSGTTVVRNQSNNNRFDIYVPIQVCDISDQVGATVSQIA